MIPNNLHSKIFSLLLFKICVVFELFNNLIDHLDARIEFWRVK